MLENVVINIYKTGIDDDDDNDHARYCILTREGWCPSRP